MLAREGTPLTPVPERSAAHLRRLRAFLTRSVYRPHPVVADGRLRINKGSDHDLAYLIPRHGPNLGERPSRSLSAQNLVGDHIALRVLRPAKEDFPAPASGLRGDSFDPFRDRVGGWWR